MGTLKGGRFLINLHKLFYFPFTPTDRHLDISIFFKEGDFGAHFPPIAALGNDKFIELSENTGRCFDVASVKTSPAQKEAAFRRFLKGKS